MIHKMSFIVEMKASKKKWLLHRFEEKRSFSFRLCMCETQARS